jgi:hypothetical protein
MARVLQRASAAVSASAQPASLARPQTAPKRRALRQDRCLPASVLGPVECCALAWLISVRFDISCLFDKEITSAIGGRGEFMVADEVGEPTQAYAGASRSLRFGSRRRVIGGCGQDWPSYPSVPHLRFRNNLRRALESCCALRLRCDLDSWIDQTLRHAGRGRSS